MGPSVGFELPADEPQSRSQQFLGDYKDVYHDVDIDLPSTSYNQGTGPTMSGFADEETSSVDSADVIANAKYRLRNLDKEAQVCVGKVFNISIFFSFCT